jgi:hypothetical protein
MNQVSDWASEDDTGLLFHTTRFLLDLLLVIIKQHIIFHIEDLILSHVKVHAETATYFLEKLEYSVGSQGSISMTEELQSDSTDWNNRGKSKIQDRNRLFKSGTKVLNERFSHIITCGITAAHSIIGTIL